ncbi:hypothetical protein DRF65_26435 [Chryseobacterium pennae]|uniref:Uncharacterized protein n=1 Tax=Chryseobacterium pennae TaxID=2258962 RepID=A0A3D9C0I0_9FLAO|nr:hypothetical protein DRF65_26435 [Chryseobacterium pennae]
MNSTNSLESTFNFRGLITAALPAYVFPALMSFISGFLLQNNNLMTASYSSIGLSSLLSTLCSFTLLWQLESKRILVRNKLIRSLLIIVLIMGLATLGIWLFNWHHERFNILFSTFLGAAILIIRDLVIKRNS